MKITRNQALKYGAVLALTAGAVGSQAAAIDVSAATAGIAEAGVAILAVLGALLAMSVSLFGLGKVYAFIRRKSGG